jgi:hypothetical protein
VGRSIVLDREEFEETFSAEGEPEVQRRAAAVLAESCEARVWFTGTDSAFARFERRQSASAVRRAIRRRDSRAD